MRAGETWNTLEEAVRGRLHVGVGKCRLPAFSERGSGLGQAKVLCISTTSFEHPLFLRTGPMGLHPVMHPVLCARRGWRRPPAGWGGISKTEPTSQWRKGKEELARLKGKIPEITLSDEEQVVVGVFPVPSSSALEDGSVLTSWCQKGQTTFFLVVCVFYISSCQSKTYSNMPQ